MIIIPATTSRVILPPPLPVFCSVDSPDFASATVLGAERNIKSQWKTCFFCLLEQNLCPGCMWFSAIADHEFLMFVFMNVDCPASPIQGFICDAYLAQKRMHKLCRPITITVLMQCCHVSYFTYFLFGPLNNLTVAVLLVLRSDDDLATFESGFFISSN